MSIVALVLSLAQVVPESPSLPIASFGPMARYMNCLFDRPDDAGGLPPSRAARAALADAVIEACKPVRTESAAAVEAILAADGHYSNPTDRRAAVASFLSALERRLRLQIVEREAVLEADRADEN